MPERAGPRVYSIAAHRGFADALVAGLIPRYGSADLGLARLTVLLPSRRAVRTLTEAFVRQVGQGMLLPRMVVAGDLDLDETLGPLLDPLGAADIPPAADPMRRWLRLAHYLRVVEGDAAGPGPAVLRRAWELGRTMDRLLVEGIAPIDVMSERMIGIVGDLAGHWSDNMRTFLKVQQYWIAELSERGEIDAPERRNRLFGHAARRWKEVPPAHPVVAAGVTSASPAVADFLRVVSELDKGSVILPDLDLSLSDEVWEELGTAGAPADVDDPPFGPADAVTHPQYHLKVLLHRMGVARGEVRPWHRAGLSAARPERSKAISNLFLPPRASAAWVDLKPEHRRLSGVRLMETAHPGEEARAIALLIRQAVEVPERRVALVTPDRGLAGRVVSDLKRWGIEADDTAGTPLSHTAAGRLALLIAEVLAEQAAPVPLIGLLMHPLSGHGDRRAAWLESVRKLDLALRGPRPGAGLAPIEQIAASHRLEGWWAEVQAILTPMFALPATGRLSTALQALAEVAEGLAGEAAWSGPDGRALGAFIDEFVQAAEAAETQLDARDLHAVMRDAMDRISVRPPWGGHPRVAIYGLLEARMSRADLVICGGLVEGTWPASPAQDAMLPPALLRALGVPGGDFRIGLAAHDLAAALGAPEVVLSWARRDDGGPVIPSRFVLRVKAMLGDQADRHDERAAPRLAQMLDRAAPVPPHPRPRPMPTAQQRKVDLSVTGLDRLRGDPYQFYANAILKLRTLDRIDAGPSPAWQGTAAHAILERWHLAGDPPGGLHDIAEHVLDEMSAHPLMRALWRPRLLKALDWVDAQIAAQVAAGRNVIAVEKWGDMRYRDVRIHGRADRIDRLPDDTLAVVDYKTGKPPSTSRVQEGFALQLGLIGLIAEAGGFPPLAGEANTFEYWSLGKKKDQLGFIETPLKIGKKRNGIEPIDFLPLTKRFLDDALDRWILGDEPFTARLNPELGSYADYDQLMRLDEWITSLGDSDDVETRQ